MITFDEKLQIKFFNDQEEEDERVSERERESFIHAKSQVPLFVTKNSRDKLCSFI